MANISDFIKFTWTVETPKYGPASHVVHVGKWKVGSVSYAVGSKGDDTGFTGTGQLSTTWNQRQSRQVRHH